MLFIIFPRNFCYFNNNMTKLNCIPFLSKFINNKFRRSIHQYNYAKAIQSINYPKRDTPRKYKRSYTALRRDIKNDSNIGIKKDYYAILGVKKNAKLNEIKKAYYDLARKFHPDATQELGAASAAKTFQEVSEAYHVLSDESKRAEFDLYGTVKDVGSFLRVLSSRSSKSNTQMKNFTRIVPDRNYAAENAPPGMTQNASDELNLTLTFLQAVQGTTKDVNAKVLSVCNECGGLQGRQKNILEICKICNGTGKNITSTKSVVLKRTCKACKGSKYTTRQECKQCNNAGYITNHSKISVVIPPGINNGDLIKVPHPDGKNTVNVRIQVTKHKNFKRIVNDILSEEYLTLTDAILGGTFKVKGIFEELEVKLPEGVESHTKIRLPGKGIRTKTAVGDHIILFKVKIPKCLSSKQKELLKILTKIENS